MDNKEKQTYKTHLIELIYQLKSTENPVTRSVLVGIIKDRFDRRDYF